MLTTCRKFHFTLIGKVCCVQHRDFIATESFSLHFPIFLKKLIFTVRHKVAKVMFSQACVCPQADLPQCMLGRKPPPGRMPQCMLGRKHPPWEGCLSACWEGSTHPPTPKRRLTLRTVRILLECILVGAYKNEMSVLRSTNRPPRYKGYEIIRPGVIILKKSTSTDEKLSEL